jgi:hypothetical protein
VQTFLPYPDLSASCRALDDKRLGKQRVETFQVLRALTWARYGWKNHPVTKMWRGFVPALVSYGVASCREWTARGYADALLPQLLQWSGGREPVCPELPPWFGTEELHRSHRSNLLRKDPELYRPLFCDDPDDLPYLWPAPAFPQWPLRPGLGITPFPWQGEVVAALSEGRDVLLVSSPCAGATTAALLAGQRLGRTVIVQRPLGMPATPAPALPAAVRVDRPQRTSATIARAPSEEDLEAMQAQAQPPQFVFRGVPEAADLVVLDLVEPDHLTEAPTLLIVREPTAAQLAALRTPVVISSS